MHQFLTGRITELTTQNKELNELLRNSQRAASKSIDIASQIKDSSTERSR